VTPDRLPPRPGYGFANYGRIFGSLESEPGLNAGGALKWTPDDLVAMMDAAGVEKGVVMAPEVTNAQLVELVRAHPDRFIALAYLSPRDGMGASRELERLVREDGLHGLMVCALDEGLPANDRRYYPLYAKCVELDVPLSIHTSANWTTVASNDLGHPRHIDVVAADFPDLKIIMSHAGYPWVLEAVLLAWKYPNVYLELAAHRPRYMAMPGTGWEPLLRFGPTTIREKVLFGTGWFLLGRPPAQLVDEFRALPVPDDVMELWLGENARSLFGDRLGG
jgi:predicted TIM-barrel fold metal-dependent hydrolase